VPMIDRSTLIKLAVGALLVLIAAGLSGVLLREPLIRWGEAFIDRFGLLGLLIGVIFADSSIVPLSNEPLVLLALSAGVSPWTAFAVTALGSVLAGPVGWTCGRLLGAHTSVVLRLARRYPQVVAMLTLYGARFVAAAALLPFPFAVATWLAGASGVRFSHLLLASLLRIPKTAFYVALLAGGWAMGA
jgi:membrane protein YqaA with SNARE-associated domain